MTTAHPPVPIQGHHRVDHFSCGVESLDQWLAERAWANQASGVSRTFVVTDDDDAVLAYYCLATGSILRSHLPRSFRHGTPQQVPVLILGRFAVDRGHQGCQLGRSLLQDVLLRCARISQDVGFVALLVHPVDPAADRFWRRFGFLPCPTDEQPALILPLSHLPRTSQAESTTS